MTLEEFINLPNIVPLNVEYGDNIEEYVIGKEDYVRIGKVLHGELAILYVIEERVDEVLRDFGVGQITLTSLVLGLMGRAEIEAAGIIQVQEQPYLDLKGSGVLIGFVDTGIDYKNDIFIYEDNTSKIFSIWDQTIQGKHPKGYYFGSEYTNEEINQAIISEDPLKIVPHEDTVGHGTFLASIAAGRQQDAYVSSAPDTELIVVKLRKSAAYYRKSHLVPEEQENVFDSADAILGIEYMLEKAIELNRPLVICIALGTSIAGHDSFSEMEEYLSKISNISGICVCTAAGNESHTRHHTNGFLTNNQDVENIEIVVPEGAESFPVYLWNNHSDQLSVAIKSPTGEVIDRIPAKTGVFAETSLVSSSSIVDVQYFFPLRESGSQVTIIKFIDPIPGVWTIMVYGDIVLEGKYDAWLPVTGLVSQGIEFLRATPECTIVIPATAIGSITCGAYSSKNDTLYEESSWGPTRMPVISPDLVAPGVGVTGYYPDNIGVMTGTSVATSITAGACALMLQWGIVQGHDITLNTYRIRAYLIRGCIKDPNILYPSNQWGYGKLNLYNTFRKIIAT